MSEECDEDDGRVCSRCSRPHDYMHRIDGAWLCEDCDDNTFGEVQRTLTLMLPHAELKPLEVLLLDMLKAKGDAIHPGHLGAAYWAAELSSAIIRARLPK